MLDNKSENCSDASPLKQSTGSRTAGTTVSDHKSRYYIFIIISLLINEKCIIYDSLNNQLLFRNSNITEK